MRKIIPNPPKIEIDFTDACLTVQGGWALLARAARALDLPRRLSEAVRLKQRDRGASDGEMLWSLVASLSAGGQRRAVRSGCPASIRWVANCWGCGKHRLAVGWANRFDSAEVGALHRVARELARQLARQLAPTAIAHKVAERGYMPVFEDCRAIEVEGALFEGAGKGYDGTMQYWLHGEFVGPLWVNGRLHPGGVGVTRG